MTEVEEKYLYEYVGDQIKTLRNKAGFNQEDLAEKLGKSRVSIVNIEKGRQHPSLHFLIEVGRIFNVSVDVFIPKDFTRSTREKQKLKTKINRELKSVSNTFGEEFDSKAIFEFFNSISENNSKKK